MPNCYGYIHRRCGRSVKEMKAATLERFDHLWETRPTLRYRCTLYDREPLYYPFGERRLGRRLVELASPGDHVVFGKLGYGFGSLEDVLATKRRWADLAITMHFADMPVESSNESAGSLDSFLAELVHIRRTSSTPAEVERRDMELLIAKLCKGRR